MTELEKEEGSVKKRGEGRGADGAAGDRADLAISAGVVSVVILCWKRPDIAASCGKNCSDQSRRILIHCFIDDKV